MTHLQSALARNSEPRQRAALPPGDTLGRWAISGSHGVWHFPATAHLTPSVLEAPGCPCALENWEALPFYAKHSQQILTGISALRLLWCRFFYLSSRCDSVYTVFTVQSLCIDTYQYFYIYGESQDSNVISRFQSPPLISRLWKLLSPGWRRSNPEGLGSEEAFNGITEKPDSVGPNTQQWCGQVAGKWRSKNLLIKAFYSSIKPGASRNDTGQVHALKIWWDCWQLPSFPGTLKRIRATRDQPLCLPGKLKFCLISMKLPGTASVPNMKQE